MDADIRRESRRKGAKAQRNTGIRENHYFILPCFSFAALRLASVDGFIRVHRRLSAAIF
jgi:hypothetical protein